MSEDTPQALLFELCHAHVAARALHVVAELGVADNLHTEPRTIHDLAGDVGVDPDALGRVLRLVETTGVFSSDGTGRWQHTAASQWLRSDHARSLRPYVRMIGTPFCWGPLTALDHAVGTGEASVCTLDPPEPWAYLEAHPDENAIFQQAMTAKAHADGAAVLAAYDFSRHHHVADIGGGHGHLIKAVLAAHENVFGTLFDLPHVVAATAPAPRLNVVGGDFFRDPLPESDAYVLMTVVHDWNDEQAVQILARLGGVAAPGSTVLLLETIMPNGRAPHWAKTLDVIMLAVTGGRERTLDEYDALLAKAGLDLTGVIPTATGLSILESRVR